MRVFHELSDEEIASLCHLRTLAVLGTLVDYDCDVLLRPTEYVAYVEVLGVGRITTSTETYQVYDTKGLLQGYYVSAMLAVYKLLEKEEARWPKFLRVNKERVDAQG